MIDDINHITDINEIRKLYYDEKEKRIQLENDCDLLSLENIRLTNELLKYKQNNSTINQSTRNKQITTKPIDVITNGDNSYANKVDKIITNPCNNKNVLCVNISSINDKDLIAFGGVDNIISIYDMNSMIKISTYRVAAPVLSFSCYSHLLAGSLMDGSFVIINLLIDSSEELSIKSYKDHSKYCYIKWSKDGKYLSSSSNDKSINLYERIGDDVVKIQSFKFSLTPESIEFYIDLSTSNNILIIALRESCNLIYLDCLTYAQTLISLNEAIWDNHVSFNPLYLSISPNNEILLVCTDKSSIIAYRPNTSERIGVFVGHNCGEYGKPRVVWDHSGDYFYINSDGEHCIYVYSLFDKKVIDILHGHNGLVKDISIHPINRIIGSASFDHNGIIWKRLNE